MATTGLDTLPVSVDEVARWWAAIVSLAAHWIAGDDDVAEKLYPIADAFPKHLQKVEYVYKH